MSIRHGRWLAAALAVLLVGLVPGVTLGHAELDHAAPADKATVTTPTEVVLTFTELLDPAKSSIKVANADGTIVVEGSQVDAGNPKVMRLALPRSLVAGLYTVRWISASAEDGDLDHGTTTFTVAAAIVSPSASVSPSIANTLEPSVLPSLPASSFVPAPSAPASSVGDALTPIVAAVLVVAAFGLWLLRGRGRGRGVG